MASPALATNLFRYWSVSKMLTCQGSEVNIRQVTADQFYASLTWWTIWYPPSGSVQLLPPTIMLALYGRNATKLAVKQPMMTRARKFRFKSECLLMLPKWLDSIGHHIYLFLTKSQQSINIYFRGIQGLHRRSDVFDFTSFSAEIAWIC